MFFTTQEKTTQNDNELGETKRGQQASHLLQPKKKNQKMTMSLLARHHLLQSKGKKLENYDKPRGSSSSFVVQEKNKKHKR